MDVNGLRGCFPGLNTDNEAFIYFDNAATSQRPLSVVQKVSEMSLIHNANIHRAVYGLASEATEAYESARNAARQFLGAAEREEIILTSGATAAINLVAYSFSDRFINAGDAIIVGEAEHHSNLVPWQLAAKRRNAKVKYWHIDDCGRYDLNELRSLLTPEVRIVCISHASNVLGLLNPVEQIVDICHSASVPVLVDGAQGAVHQRVDVQKLGCDFYAFSAHKLFGPTGVGVLYGRRELLEQMPPFLSGGEMVGTVSLSGTTYAQLPMKFEAGTQNFNNAAALPIALELMSNTLKDIELNRQLDETKQWLYSALSTQVEGLHLYGSVHPDAVYGTTMEEKLPIFSFSIDGVHHEDLAILLDKMGIAVRSGQMCAEPLMTRFGVRGMLRVSLLQYNTMQEARRFMDCLCKAVSMLK